MNSPPFHPFRPIWWDADGLSFIDWRFLPTEVTRSRALDIDSVLTALETSAVRGQGCVGIFCGFAVALARQQFNDDVRFGAAIERLTTSVRDDANAIDVIKRISSAPEGTALNSARTVLKQTIDVDDAIARHAAELLPATGRVITHGYSGALATGGSGTALAGFITAHQAGKALRVFVGETIARPDGAHLAAHEVRSAGLHATVFSDGAAPALMQSLPVAAVLVSARAVAGNGDIVADVGTLCVALAAAHHRIPMYVAARRAALDPAAATGGHLLEQLISSAGIADRDECAPRFDLTPGRLITAVVTEYGLARPPYHESLSDVLSRPRFDVIPRP